MLDFTGDVSCVWLKQVFAEVQVCCRSLGCERRGVRLE